MKCHSNAVRILITSLYIVCTGRQLASGSLRSVVGNSTLQHPLELPQHSVTRLASLVLKTEKSSTSA